MPSHIEEITASDPLLNAQSTQLNRFERFPELPEKVRLRVWHFACHWQRVVGIHEEPYEDYHGTDIDLSFRIRMRSTTRCPAVLGVCKESRTTGLTIYKVAAKGMQTTNNNPIYMNPDVDIMHRGQGPCEIGGAFSFVELKPNMVLSPLVGTKHVAVDLLGLSGRHRHTVEWILKLREQVGLPPPDSFEMDRLMKSRPTQVDQVAACVMNGVTTISVIVGNDDDESEVTLIPMRTSNTMYSDLTPREKGALEEIQFLKDSLAEHWLKEQELNVESYINTSPPTIKAVTVKRKPIPKFHQFQLLPAELQDMIWKYTLQTPKCSSVEYMTDSEEYHFCVNRPPAIFFVNRASRHIAMTRPYWNTHQGGKLAYFTPAIDTIRPKPDSTNVPRDFSRIPGVVSVGIQWSSRMSDFLGAQAKQYVGLQEVVIIIGNRRSECQMELVPLQRSCLPDPRKDLMFHHQVKVAQTYARFLEMDMEKASRKWKTYQRRRVKQGKSSPDWIVPKVRIAHMRPICHTESVYSYSQRDRTQKVFETKELLKDRYYYELEHADRQNYHL